MFLKSLINIWGIQIVHLKSSRSSKRTLWPWKLAGFKSMAHVAAIRDLENNRKNKKQQREMIEGVWLHRDCVYKLYIFWSTPKTVCIIFTSLVLKSLSIYMQLVRDPQLIDSTEGHFTHEPRAVTMSLWEPKRKCPKPVPTRLQNHVVWSRTHVHYMPPGVSCDDWKEEEPSLSSP